jgi:intracellular multiplication protein IcmL
MILMLGMMYAIYYLTAHRPAPRYFATDATGRIVKLIPLGSPAVSDTLLQNWAVRAATSSFTFNYIQLNQQLETAKDTYFTSQGGTAYMSALNNSGDLDAVVQGKFIVTAAPTGAPEILNRGQMNGGLYKGHYAWIVRIPMQVNFNSVQQNVNGSRNINVQMTIVRTSSFVDSAVPNIDGLQGIGVSQLLVQGMGNSNSPQNNAVMQTTALNEQPFTSVAVA